MLKMMHRVTKQFLLIAGASLFGLFLYFGVRKFLILSGIPVTDDNIRYGVIFIVLIIGILVTEQPYIPQLQLMMVC